jgi:chorismate synthase
MGIRIGAHLKSVAGIEDRSFDPMKPELDEVFADFPVLDQNAGAAMRKAVADARKEMDSVGGIIECAITGLPVGLGEPMFGGMESRIAQIVYGIPAVKGLEFGAGFGAASMRGSENNDDFSVTEGKTATLTNHAGGILGGITNGMPLIFRTAIKPTPSIAKQQQTVTDGNTVTLEIKGRHDPCIAPRAVPVVEAAAAIAVFDAILSQDTSYRRINTYGFE